MNGIKKIMTSKNAKTIMFGILIAMMILPFSMVEPAEAQKATPNISDRLDDLIDDYNRIENERRSLVDELRAESDSDKRDIIQKKIDVKLASMQKIMDEVDKLAPIEGDYNPTKKRSKRAITQGSTIYFSDNHKACSDWDLKTTSLGSGSIDVNVDTISWNWGVTNHKNVGFAAIFGCVDVYFEDVSFTTRNNSKKQSCTSVTDNVTAGNQIQTCNCGIDNNNLLSWQIGTTYEPVSGTDTRGNDNWHGLHRVT